MSGMFWHNNYAQSVQIDSLLNEENITLNKLMDAEDILQECKGQNKKLIEYLTRSDILEELINLITEEPSQDLEERWRYKYSNVACELLTCDVPILTEKLAGNETLLIKLYSFIDKDQPLNPLLASFFSKTIHSFIRRASDQNWFSYQFVCIQVLEFLKSRKNFIDLLLQHLQTSAIMDLILALLIKIESDEMRQNILYWLDDQQLIQRLVKLLSPSSNPEKHANASQILCEIIKSCRADPEKRPDPTLETLQSDDTIKLILDTILSGEKLESSIVGGVRVLKSLLGQKESKNTEIVETYAVPLNNTVEIEQRNKFASIIIDYLDNFNQLLLDPPEKPSVKTTAGFLEKPFGRSRLYILKLYVSLLSIENPRILEKFVELNSFDILLDLFFQYSWNNFLHTQVRQCFSLIINCDCSEVVYSHIFIKGKLINRILEAWENNENTLNRQGYMGHLIIMTNEIVECCEARNVLSNYLKTNLPEETMQKWENFIATTLSEINKKQQLSLPPDTYLSSSVSSKSGNSDEYNAYFKRNYSDEYAAFPQDSYSQDEQSGMFSDYNFSVEKFDEIDVFHKLIKPLNNILFENTEDDYKKTLEKIRSFEDFSRSDQWNSDWLNKRKNSNSNSSDEEEEDDPRDVCIDADAVNPWNSAKPLSTSDTSNNLWNTEAPKPVEETGWANFDNFNSAFSSVISFQNNFCIEAKAELPKVPIIVNENITLPESETGNNSNSGNQENVNEMDDAELKTEKINVSSELNSDCIETSVNIPDGNANLTIVENRTSELKDVSNSSEDSSSNILEASSENIQTVISSTDNVSPILTAAPNESK